jgi:hypothetical protein
MSERARRAKGIPAGCLAVSTWPLDPAHEIPGRRFPMSALPPPERSLLQRIGIALGGLGLVLVANTGLMVLVQHLTMPG